MPRSTSAIQQEIRQRKPFRSESQEGAIALLRTADLMRRHFDGALEPFGITGQQFNVLRILRGTPDGLPTLEIMERLIERAPGITRMIDRLEAKGWVRRKRSSHDRRQVFCRLTPKGKALLARIDPEIDRADEAALAMLSRTEQRRLIRLLDSVRRGLG